MKKSKILLVTVLALVLCLLCVTTSTFSWLPRPKTEQGISLSWNPSYETSVGKDITMKTFPLTEDGKEPVDETGKPVTPQEVTNFSYTNLGSGHRNYYRTDITNSGTEAQSVSLYLSSLDIGKKDGSFHLGVNGPLRTYKSYPQSSGSGSTPTSEKVSSDTVRIYFRPNNVDSWKDDSTVIKIRCDNNNDVLNPNFTTTITMKAIANSNPRTLYADIPITTKMCQIYANDSWEKTNGTPFMSLPSYCPNLSLTKSYLFVLQSGVDDEWQNHNCDTSEVSNGANIANYYSSIDIPQGGTFSAALTSGTDYSGKTIEYYSGNENVFTVDKSTGQITVAAGAQVGAVAKLYTKVIGAYGSADANSDDNDQKQVETTITITKAPTSETDTLTDVPIVTNVKVGAATGEGENKRNTVVSVYWYIKNEGSDPLTYTIGDVYLTL